MSGSKIFTTNVTRSLYFSISTIIPSTFAKIRLAVRTKEVFNNIPFSLAHKLEKFLNFLLAVVGSGAMSGNFVQWASITACKLRNASCASLYFITNGNIKTMLEVVVIGGPEYSTSSSFHNRLEEFQSLIQHCSRHHWKCLKKYHPWWNVHTFFGVRWTVMARPHLHCRIVNSRL